MLSLAADTLVAAMLFFYMLTIAPSRRDSIRSHLTTTSSMRWLSEALRRIAAKVFGS
jgi:hypothetical protein